MSTTTGTNFTGPDAPARIETNSAEAVEELRNRLIRRAEDAEDVIERRLENSKVEMQHWNEYEYPLINDDLDACFADVKAILRAERLRRDRRAVGMADFVGGLLK